MHGPCSRLATEQPHCCRVVLPADQPMRPAGGRSSLQPHAPPLCAQHPLPQTPAACARPCTSRCAMWRAGSIPTPAPWGEVAAQLRLRGCLLPACCCGSRWARTPCWRVPTPLSSTLPFCPNRPPYSCAGKRQRFACGTRSDAACQKECRAAAGGAPSPARPPPPPGRQPPPSAPCTCGKNLAHVCTTKGVLADNACLARCRYGTRAVRYACGSLQPEVCAARCWAAYIGRRRL